MVDALSVVRSEPGSLGGMPVFRGTRVPVQALFDYLEGGETLDQFIDPTAGTNSTERDVDVTSGDVF